MDETTTTETTLHTPETHDVGAPSPPTGPGGGSGPRALLPPHRLAREGTEATAREREILRSMARGETGKQTAERLGLSLKTVEAHRARVFDRLGAKNGPHAIYLAIQRGIISVAITGDEKGGTS